MNLTHGTWCNDVEPEDHSMLQAAAARLSYWSKRLTAAKQSLNEGQVKVAERFVREYTLVIADMQDTDTSRTESFCSVSSRD